MVWTIGQLDPKTWLYGQIQTAFGRHKQGNRGETAFVAADGHCRALQTPLGAAAGSAIVGSGAQDLEELPDRDYPQVPKPWVISQLK